MIGSTLIRSSLYSV